jgi:hypothetical protein
VSNAKRRDKPNPSSERMSHQDYDRKGSVAKKKNSDREPREASCQDELIAGKPPVVSQSDSDSDSGETVKQTSRK